MEFIQKIYLNSTSNAGVAGSGVVFGFGNNGKTKFSLQASFFSGQTGQPPSGGAPQVPGAAQVTLNPSNDGVLFDPVTLIDWNTASGQSNGDVLKESSVGPYNYISVGWNITWGNATTAVITIIAQTESTK